MAVQRNNYNQSTHVVIFGKVISRHPQQWLIPKSSLKAQFQKKKKLNFRDHYKSVLNSRTNKDLSLFRKAT